MTTAPRSFRVNRTFLIALGIASAVAIGASVFAMTSPQNAQPTAGLLPAGDWATDPVWHDGLVERATYDATKIIYGQPRTYEATFLTNKEAHDALTWTKADGSSQTREVWKHNQVEVVPTPNYDYKFITTSHLTVGDLELTRLDASSQEWCGTSFKQYQKNRGGWDYFSFSYMPEAGRRTGTIEAGAEPTIPFNSLPLVLRGYDFESKSDLRLRVLPDQKSNNFVDAEPFDARVSFAGETKEGYELDLYGTPSAAARPAKIGTFTFAKDRRHVMLAYEGANGDRYTLKSLDRINYWTRDE